MIYFIIRLCVLGLIIIWLARLHINQNELFRREEADRNDLQ